MLFCHKIHYILMINALLSQNLVVEIYALFPPIFLGWQIVPANVWRYIAWIQNFIKTIPSLSTLVPHLIDSQEQMTHSRSKFSRDTCKKWSGICLLIFVLIALFIGETAALTYFLTLEAKSPTPITTTTRSDVQHWSSTADSLSWTSLKWGKLFWQNLWRISAWLPIKRSEWYIRHHDYIISNFLLRRDVDWPRRSSHTDQPTRLWAENCDVWLGREHIRGFLWFFQGWSHYQSSHIVSS